MRHFYLKVAYLLLIAMLVSLPLLQMRYDIFKRTPLNGVYKMDEYPKLSYNDIKTGEFQRKFEAWYNQNFGLRDYFVKINNQLFYSLFNETPPGSQVVIGKGNQLYESGYINEYLNFIAPFDPLYLEEKVIELKKLQDLLQKRGKTFLLLITPSKAAIYPEYLPNHIKSSGAVKSRNYDNIVPLLNKYGVNYVDGHQITAEHAKTDIYPMFPQGGTHWNYLAAYYSTKKVVEKLEEVSGKDFANIESSGVEVAPPRDSDRDLADLINLWSPKVDYMSPRPIIVKQDVGSKEKPSFFMEGGSFSYQFIDALQKAGTFNKFDFYYYYNTYVQYKDEQVGGTTVGEISKVNWDDIFNHDVIMIEMNEQNMPKLKEGFLQDAIAQLEPIQLNFNIKDEKFVEKTKINGKDGFIFKKGALGKSTEYIESNPLNLEAGKEYTLSYKASGFQYLNTDLFPDDLPQYNNDKITDSPTEFSFNFKSDSPNMNSSTLRFFIDGLPEVTDRDTVLYDIKLTLK